jgi:hypothetical protein
MKMGEINKFEYCFNNCNGFNRILKTIYEII